MVPLKVYVEYKTKHRQHINEWTNVREEDRETVRCIEQTLRALKRSPLGRISFDFNQNYFSKQYSIYTLLAGVRYLLGSPIGITWFLRRRMGITIYTTHAHTQLHGFIVVDGQNISLFVFFDRIKIDFFCVYLVSGRYTNRMHLKHVCGHDKDSTWTIPTLPWARQLDDIGINLVNENERARSKQNIVKWQKKVKKQILN